MRWLAVLLLGCMLLGPAPAFAATSPRCIVSETVGGATFGPDFMFVTVLGLNPKDSYVATMTEPNGVHPAAQPIDYGSDHAISAFDVGPLQTGTYTSNIYLNFGHNDSRERLVATCSLTV